MNEPEKIWYAPAKLNLMLRITGRKENGYHNLQTVFQFLDYCDELTFHTHSDGHLKRTSANSDIKESDDIIIKAAQALKDYSQNQTLGASIKIKKIIPIGGGLGGGSSNAATTLVALNQLWQLHLSKAKLLEIGLLLGADVPVFVFGKSAWAEGVGEKLTAITPKTPWYLVIKPNCHVSTARIFSDPQLTRDSVPIKIDAFLAGDAINDCTASVIQQFPEVDEALKWLNQFSPAKLTGTGACVFAAFDYEGQARQIKLKAPEKWQTFVAKGRNQSILY